MQFSPRMPLVLIALIAACVGPEVIFLGADWGLWGSQRWRPLAYQNGGFWAGLLYGWRPNYSAQPFLMFVTYAFLHTGIGHLLGNMIGLASLGQIAVERLGARRFAGLYAASVLGGSIAFGGISRSPAPMVGASGAIFGLAAAWVFWDWQIRRQTQPRKALIRAVAITVGLAVANAAMWVATDGLLAWETHLGGFVAGGIMALLWRHKGAPIQI